MLELTVIIEDVNGYIAQTVDEDITFHHYDVAFEVYILSEENSVKDDDIGTCESSIPTTSGERQC